jgi:hypothetical protein
LFFGATDRDGGSLEQIFSLSAQAGRKLCVSKK